MVKVRFQGTREDICRLLNVLNQDKRISLHNPSDFYDNKGTNRYKRVYAEIYITKNCTSDN